MEKAKYVGPQVFEGTFSGRYYFAKRSRVVHENPDGSSVLSVVGQKIDVTESVARIVAKAVRAARKRRKP
jgi:cell fate regulator YaaT (PSP1 superfamily)